MKTVRRRAAPPAARAGRRRSTPGDELEVLAAARPVRERPARAPELTPAGVLGLQRLAGNAAVASLLGSPSRLAVQREQHKIVEEGEDEAEKRKAPTGPVAVQRNNGATATTPAGTAWVAGKHVAPTFTVSRPSPKRSNSAASTTSSKTPTFTGGAVVDAAGGVWRYQIDSVASKGKIQIVYYSKSHYPAPTPTDDSGPLSNVTKANHQDVVNDLRANRTGIARDWSAYRAEVLHEDYHWDVEWKGSVKPRVAAAETDIEALSVPFAKAKTASKAKSLLQPKAKTLFKARMNQARAAYNALGDSPGDPPYVAQAPAIDALVTRVENHAAAKGW